MGLQQITEEGYLYWQCHDEDCACVIRAHVRDESVSYNGSCIALPMCLGEDCTSQMFLKADYTFKDLLKGEMLMPFVGEQGTFVGYAMKLGHARNFRLLNLLYEMGKLPDRPVLPVLPIEMIKQSALADMPLDLVDSFWLSYAFLGTSISYDGIQEQMQALAVQAGITPLVQLVAPETVLVPDALLPPGRRRQKFLEAGTR